MPAPPWMDIAWAELGQREAPGAATNARIAAYFRDAGHAEVRDDETAWCSAFVGAALERAGLASTRSLMARSYLDWGVPIATPDPGAITVLSRGTDPATGHVGFLVGLTASKVILLGGNQYDAVTVEAFDRTRLLGFRLPGPDAVRRASAPSMASADPVFAEALAMVLGLEGGWTDDPYDPGGPTNKGITLATYAREMGVAVTADTIAALTHDLRRIPDDLVARIYRTRYWQPASCPDLPPPLALFHFDCAVNQGPGTAIRLLQAALRVEADGEIGPITLAAVRAADPVAVLAAYAELRRARYRSLAHFWRFGRGWLRRVDTALERARGHVGRPSLPLQPGKETTPMPDVYSDGGATTTAQTPVPPAKWWGQSLTVWGALLTAVTTVLPTLLQAFGIQITAELLGQLGSDIVTAAQAVGGLIGTVLTIVGRARATVPLESRRVSLRL